MSSIPDEFPVSLRAWPQKDDKAAALASLITRINIERGGFRNVTEESLEEEIRKAEASSSPSGSQDSSEDSSDEDEPDRVKELFVAKEQMLMQLEQAHQRSLLTLDFISLLLSKDNPVQAGQTMSQGLRENVPLGTLGIDKVADSRITPAQKDDNAIVAKGWKLQSLNENADSVLASATKLEKDIEAETKYWQQLVEVDAKGWAVCPLPQENNTLGVRFGFQESAPQFSNRSIAALRRQQDGTIDLDQGLGSTSPRRLRVRIVTNGTTTGQMSATQPVSADSAILPLILRARNSIFTDELWHELNREGRLLANQDVRCTGTEITCHFTLNKTIVLDLLTGQDDEYLNEEGSMGGVQNADDNDAATAIYLSLNLLLSHAHREKYLRRASKPQPLSHREQGTPTLPLLRFILARIKYQTTLSALRRALEPLVGSLQAAGLTKEDLGMVNTSANTQANSSNRSKKVKAPSPAASAITNLFLALESTFTVPLPSLYPLPPTTTIATDNTNTTSTKEKNENAIELRIRSACYPIVESRYLVEPPRNLNLIIPAPGGQGGSAGEREVRAYLKRSIACAIIESAITGPPTNKNENDNINTVTASGVLDDEKKNTAEVAEVEEGSESVWENTYDPTVMKCTNNGTTVAIAVIETLSPNPTNNNNKAEDANQEQRDGEIDVKLVLKALPAGKGAKEEVFIWNGKSGDGENGEKRTLGEVLESLAGVARTVGVFEFDIGTEVHAIDD